MERTETARHHQELAPLEKVSESLCKSLFHENLLAQSSDLGELHLKNTHAGVLSKKTAPEFGRRSGPRFGVSVPEQFLHSRYDVRRLAHHIFDDLLQFFTGHGIEIELPLIDISEKLGILHGRVECIT